MTHADVLILGGGIIGLACARELAGRGVGVELIERGELGGGASTASAGMLTPLAEIGRPGPMLDVCLHSRDLWADFVAELEAESGVVVDYDASGALIVDHKKPGHGRRLARVAQEVGEPASFVGAQELRSLIPDISPEIERVLLLEGEHRVDNRRVCQALERTLNRRRVRLRQHQEVERVIVEGDGVHLEGRGFRRSGDRLLVAAGAWTGKIEGLPRLPLRPVRGQIVQLEGVDWPWLGSVRGPKLYAVRRRGGKLLIGATVEDAGFAAETTPDGLMQLLEFGHGTFPGLADRPIHSTWAGLRPAARDHLPVVGQVGDGPIWMATGHYRNGILLTPWTAAAIGALMTGSTDDHAPHFSPDRFAA